MKDGVTSAHEDKSGHWTHAQVTQGQYTIASRAWIHLYLGDTAEWERQRGPVRTSFHCRPCLARIGHALDGVAHLQAAKLHVRCAQIFICCY